MAMRLVLTKNSPLNTALVDERSGLVMYEVETERSFMSRTTVIRKPFTSTCFVSFVLSSAASAPSHLNSPWNLDIHRLLSDRRGKPVPHTSTEVAKIQWKTWSSDRIVYYGCDMKRGEFMPKAGLFSE